MNQSLGNLIRKIKLISYLLDHLERRALHEVPISCKIANLFYVLYESNLAKDVLVVIEDEALLEDPSWKELPLDQFTGPQEPLLAALNQLKEIMDCKLRLTDKEDYLKRQMLQGMLEENSKLEQKIGDLRQEIAEGQSRFDAAVQSKLKMVEEQRAALESNREQIRSKLHNEMSGKSSNFNPSNQIKTKSLYRLRTDMKIKEICVDCQAKNAAIEEELKATEAQLVAILKENLEKEQIIRKEKLAAQVNLKNWLSRYDREIGDRTTTLRELHGIFQNEKSYLEQLEAAFVQQEAQYIALMTEKETEAKRLQEERMLLFMMNRAARIIQHNWRMVLAKRKPKKGKRKGKKK